MNARRHGGDASEPAGASTRSMGVCSTSCSARPTTSAGCRPARSPARRSTRDSRSAHEDAVRQHAEMVVRLRGERRARATCSSPTRLCRTRCSPATRAINVPEGPIVTQCAQWWRRGEYAPVIRFYQGAGIPIREMVTAGSFEGGDFMIVEPGVAAIGTGEERTQEQAARQLAGWLEAEGWEVRVERDPAALPPHRRARLHAGREARGGLRGAGVERLRELAAREGRGDRAGHARGGAQARRERRRRSAATACSRRPSRRTSTSACARSG